MFLFLKVNRMKTTSIKLRGVIRLYVLYFLVTFGNTCGPSEYKSSKGECCPMCNIGSVVYRDCSGEYSTTCIPCSSGTFMNAPNGLYKCLTCKNCSKSKGIYILSPCNTIKDTVCDVLDGYYCVDYSNSQCQLAQKHSVCKPGNETKASGTKSSDTKCEACPSGFYSPTGRNCIRWTDCAAKNEIQTEAGSSIKDVTCTQRRSSYCVIFPISAAVLLIVGYIWLYLKSPNKQQVSKSPIEETTPHMHCNTTRQTPEEHKEEEETPVVSSPPSVGTSTDHKQGSVGERLNLLRVL